MTQLPANLRLLPGVRSDHKGRKYQFAEYPSGKRITVPYQDGHATEPARTIPVREPDLIRYDRLPPHVRTLLALKRQGVTTTTNSKGELIPVVHKPTRLHVIQMRWNGQDHWSSSTTPNGQQPRELLASLQPLVRSPDLGKTWQIVGAADAYQHVQYHIDQEIT